MTTIKICSALLLLLSYSVVASLEHEKSFLLQDGASIVYSIGFYKDSLLFTSTNDIVQKDIETGAIQRTFRAHKSLIQSFLIINDSRMITSGWDDMIIFWDLESGSVMKRIWLKASQTLVYSISFQNNQVFTGGLDKKVRQVDLVLANVLQTIGDRLTFSN